MNDTSEHVTHEPQPRLDPTQMRRLPWDSPEGKSCFLSTSDDNSVMSRLADAVETAQLVQAHRVLAEADEVLDIPPRKLSVAQARHILARMQEALSDALRVAESRGGRLGTSTHDEEHSTASAPLKVPEARPDPCP
jgi:hypothetical protein